MVTARADYRVKSRHGVTPKECVDDARSAVRWFRENAGKLGVDPNRIVASGGSAGGHIAACTTLMPEEELKDEKVSCKANALILFNPVLRFGPQMLQRINNDEAIGIGIHHPLFGKALKEKMDALNIPCEVVAAGKRLGGGTPTKAIDFLIENLGLKKGRTAN